MKAAPRPPLNGLRGFVLVSASLETLAWVHVLWNAAVANEPATRGLDRGLALVASIVFAGSTGPALLLALRGTRLRLAALLAALPPAALVVAVLFFFG